MTKIPKSINSEKLYSVKEIGLALNNCVAATMRPDSLGCEIPEGRKRRLRNIATGVLEELEQMVKADLLRPEEVTFFLVAGAFAFHVKNSADNDSLPFANLCKELLSEKARKKVSDILEKADLEPMGPIQ